MTLGDVCEHLAFQLIEYPQLPLDRVTVTASRRAGIAQRTALPNGEIQTFYVQLLRGIPGLKVTVIFHLTEAPEKLALRLVISPLLFFDFNKVPGVCCWRFPVCDRCRLVMFQDVIISSHK